jgi:hypothetical protein
VNLRAGASALATVVLTLAACGGPLVPSPIEGEPICPDFEIGATHAAMRGSLRFPVSIAVREGTTPITRATLSGRRTQGDPPSRVLLADADAEYEIDWAQCENQRAPRALTLSHPSKEKAEYECGNAPVYRTEKLVTRKGDAASRTVKFVAPPKLECWESEVPRAEPPPAPAAAPEAIDAGAADAGGEAAVHGGATDAGATDTAGAGKADAGATDAGKAKAKSR